MEVLLPHINGRELVAGSWNLNLHPVTQLQPHMLKETPCGTRGSTFVALKSRGIIVCRLPRKEDIGF
jgi:hypothetical protein